MASFGLYQKTEKQECSNCAAVANLALCSRCHTAWFCSVKCQKVRLALTASTPRSCPAEGSFRLAARLARRIYDPCFHTLVFSRTCRRIGPSTRRGVIRTTLQMLWRRRSRSLRAG